MIAAGKRAHGMRTASTFGIASVEPEIDMRAVHDHVHGVIAAIAPNDSVERFTGLGVRVIQAAGRFVDKSTVVAGEYRIKARRFVIATGSTPLVPPIPGLDSVPYFTNETIFENQERLPELLIVGGGPIGMELAQAHARLGSRVTVIEAAKALGKDDPELTKVVLERLRQGGRHHPRGHQGRERRGRASATCASTSPWAMRKRSSKARICCSRSGASRPRPISAWRLPASAMTSAASRSTQA